MNAMICIDFIAIRASFESWSGGCGRTVRPAQRKKETRIPRRIQPENQAGSSLSAPMYSMTWTHATIHRANVHSAVMAQRFNLCAYIALFSEVGRSACTTFSTGYLVQVALS